MFETIIHDTHSAATDEQIRQWETTNHERQQTLLHCLAAQDTLTNDHEKRWLLRSYPVLAILAPVMSTHEKTVEYPGDPMCLYAALSVAAAQAHQAYAADFGPQDPYNDLCPRWGPRPSLAYRLQVTDSGIRPDYTLANSNSDQTVFDPRVWNGTIRDYFIEQVLIPLRPRVVLISTVSPGFRYAVQIAQTVREYCPEALIVLGGRHVDETVQFNYATQQLELLPSGPIATMSTGQIPPVFDVVVSGDAYYAVDSLMKAISLAMDIEQKTATTTSLVSTLNDWLVLRPHQLGNALIVVFAQQQLHLYPLPGRKLDLALLPNPYDAFAIRARFPIFQHSDGHIMRTAHILLVDACPYQCNFCSEGVSVMQRIQRFGTDPLSNALQRVLDCVNYGAEALFFDDSVFWGGNVRQMIAFCEMLAQRRVAAAAQSPDAVAQRLINLQWGAQLTVEFLTSLLAEEQAQQLLAAMRAAGCTYIYIGLESLASAVINSIHKNIQRNNGRTWSEKIWDGLHHIKRAGLRAGTSVLFGLDGETRETIAQTIVGVETLIEHHLIEMASPNILTYHPNTEITRLHNKHNSLDYHSPNLETYPPYTFFEEAFPGVVSIALNEDDIWYIHYETQKRWGKKRLGVGEQIT